MSGMEVWLARLRHARWRLGRLFARRDSGAHARCVRGEDEDGEPIFFLLNSSAMRDETPDRKPDDDGDPDPTQ